MRRPFNWRAAEASAITWSVMAFSSGGIDTLPYFIRRQERGGGCGGTSPEELPNGSAHPRAGSRAWKQGNPPAVPAGLMSRGSAFFISESGKLASMW